MKFVSCLKTGYVGLSMATLLAQHHSVVAEDVVVEEVIEKALEVNPGAVVVIKSTVPVGYCSGLCER